MFVYINLNAFLPIPEYIISVASCLVLSSRIFLVFCPLSFFSLASPFSSLTFSLSTRFISLFIQILLYSVSPDSFPVLAYNISFTHFNFYWSLSPLTIFTKLLR
ncbi:hypothetical protein E2C01_061592 [Portunus trituberculatus]|uniref:Uncharacterized protein n=1 Tax=Portunus trituberculatus TaxID=210409 RepID=A0A5B7HDM5_PORTR|nr:hypothetical protein [Portunus trituberculatus]